MAERTPQHLFGTTSVFHSAFLLPVTCALPPLAEEKARSYPLSGLVNDIVYDSVFLRLLRIHDEVAFHVFFHLIQFLPAVLGQQLVCNLPHTKDFAGVDVNVSSLTRKTPHRRLVN